MPPKDPFTFPKEPARLPNLSRVFQRSQRRPPVGVTQGGSSRKNPGCKSAATDGLQRAMKPTKGD